MQGLGYWIMQFVLAAVTLFLILLGIDLLSGAKLADGLWMSLAWAVAMAAMFTAARYSRSRKH
jgi:hypothetical protein